MKRLSLVLLSCSTALQGPPRVTSCTRRPATDDAAEVPAVIDDETLERELPIDFGSSGTQWTFEWPAVDDEPWSVRDVAGGGAMFAACHIASGALGAPSDAYVRSVAEPHATATSSCSQLEPSGRSTQQKTWKAIDVTAG